jgi:hypothetical protein
MHTFTFSPVPCELHKQKFRFFGSLDLRIHQKFFNVPTRVMG